MGVTLETKIKIAKHIKIKVAKIKRMYMKLRSVVKTNWGLNYKTLKNLYKTVFVPITLYAVGAWGDLLTNTLAAKLERQQRPALIILTRTYRTISTDALQVTARKMPLNITAKIHYYKYKVRKKEPFIWKVVTFNFDINSPDEVNKNIREQCVY